MRSYHEQDYYELLELRRDATRDEIDAAYERLKNVFESSSSATYMLFGDDEADNMRQLLEEAYLTLTDDLERERYDDKLGLKKQQDEQEAPARSSSLSSTTQPLVSPIDEADLVEEPREEASDAAQPAPQPASPPPPAMVVESPREDESMEYSGGVLMRVRESKAVTLEAIAQRTKISLTHLRAIEANQYDKLPARVYVRGFVGQYAKFLGLNAERVCASYLAIYDRFVQAKSTS